MSAAAFVRDGNSSASNMGGRKNGAGRKNVAARLGRRRVIFVRVMVSSTDELLVVFQATRKDAVQELPNLSGRGGFAVRWKPTTSSESLIHMRTLIAEIVGVFPPRIRV